MRNLNALRLISVAAVVIAAGCKLPIGEDTKTDPANGTGSTKDWAMTIAVSHDNFSVAQGATDTMIVTITRTGGFTGPVNFEFNNSDSGIVVTAESVTTTGAVTTSRILTTVKSGHPPFSNGIYGLRAVPVSSEVEGAFADVHFSVIRKNGTFINAPLTLSIGRGQSITQRISLIRTNYNLPVPMNLFNAPAGMTATFSPNPIPGADTVTQMTLTADASLAEGTYSIGVRSSEGVPGFQGTAPVTVTVTPPGSFTFTLSTGTLAVPKNTTVPIGVIIARTNFGGAITFAVSGVPAGVTLIMNNPATTNNFQISFANGATATPGSYQVTVTASSPGVASPPPATLTLNIS